MDMNHIVNILLSVGVPAGTKGFTYICDAMELFDSDPYYADGKICVLYHEVAKKHNTTSSRVQRAIRHAFETAITKGDRSNVEKYLDLANRQNSNLLRTLYLKSKQSIQTVPETPFLCDSQKCAMKKQIYLEIMNWLSEEMKQLTEDIPELKC